MKTLFHGTTKANYEQILEKGFSPRNMVWNCSSDTDVYFYDTDKTNYDGEEEEYIRQDCIRRAFESAQITAAVQGFNGSELIVIEIQIDEEHVEDDYSCENMHHTASVVDVDDLEEHGEVKAVYEAEEGYNPSLRFFYIAHLVRDNNYINTYEFTHLEDKACEVIANSEVYLYDSLMEFDFEDTETTFNLKELVSG